MEEGVIYCSLDGNSDYVLGEDYGFNYELYYRDSFGDHRLTQQGLDETSFDAGRYWSDALAPGRAYYVQVQTISRKIKELRDSDWSDFMLLADYSDSEASRKDAPARVASSKKEEPVIEGWKPVTQDEIKRYAVYGKENPVLLADEKNSYGVTIQNAMHGKLCFDSLEAALNGYTIGRTYNIYPAGQTAYRMNEKAKFTLSIPKALQAGSREYCMICVTENGVPVVLKDLDTNPETITFETNVYYAFALVYKDAIAK